VAYLKVFSGHSPGLTEESSENAQL